MRLIALLTCSARGCLEEIQCEIIRGENWIDEAIEYLEANDWASEERGIRCPRHRWNEWDRGAA